MDIVDSLVDFSNKYNYKWTKNDAFALSIFLQLKVALHDWDAKVLSPSARVDSLWHTLVLHTQEYLRFCETFSFQKNFIHHRPEGKEEDDQDKRYMTTWLLVRHHYADEADLALYWPSPFLEDHERARKVRKAPGDEETFNVHVKTLNGKTFTLPVSLTTVCFDFYAKFAGLAGRPVDAIRLLYAGTALSSSKLATLGDWNPNLGADATFHCIDRLRGC